MFPKEFLWGAATSSHQVEGANTNNDWWYCEQQGKFIEPSGKACNHYELFEDDFNLASELSHNAHRFSIEWSRVEPEENKFSEKEIAHYKKVIDALLKRNIEPIVTLHHFTNPLWLFKKGGWLNKYIATYFEKYTEKIVSSLGGSVKYWITINEPMVYVHASYITGAWPAGEKSLLKANRVKDNLIIAHKKAYDKIHQIYKNMNYDKPMVSIAKQFQLFQACPNNFSLLNKTAALLRNKFFNFDFMDQIKNHLDFIGLNYYTRNFVKFSLPNIKECFGTHCNTMHNHAANKNSLGWEIYPEGIIESLRALKKFNLPILITENGICTQDDNQRWDFIFQHLKQIEKALNLDIPVIGYLYWSLIDNFEWDKGFSPRFGLAEIDYSSLKRTARESTRKYANFIKSQGEN